MLVVIIPLVLYLGMICQHSYFFGISILCFLYWVSVFSLNKMKRKLLSMLSMKLIYFFILAIQIYWTMISKHALWVIKYIYYQALTIQKIHISSRVALGVFRLIKHYKRKLISSYKKCKFWLLWSLTVYIWFFSGSW